MIRLEQRPFYTGIGCEHSHRPHIIDVRCDLPSYEFAASNLEGREKFQEEISASLKDSFFHEGEVTYFFQPEPKPEN